MVDFIGVVSVDWVEGARPGFTIAGCIPMSTNRLAVVDFIRTLGPVLYRYSAGCPLAFRCVMSCGLNHPRWLYSKRHHEKLMWFKRIIKRQNPASFQKQGFNNLFMASSF